MRLKIGEFARLGQVSVSALRYYSDAGLLRPAHTDKWTS
jgi:DNA-binding transcriptional MerR regulator